MNYSGADRWVQEELILENSLNCRYVVQADISTFFPSLYSHSIPWAIKGKEYSKVHTCCSWKKNQKIGKSCSKNAGNPCENNDYDLWFNDLDTISRALKDFETNGILIGPHSSNIIAELVLTRVDAALQKSGYLKVIRYIDDYTFFAENEDQANEFLTNLSIELKKFELSLNEKKTKIIPFAFYVSSNWRSKLHQYTFPTKEKFGFTSVNSYIDYAVDISKEMDDFSPLNYAIKVVSGLSLSERAKRLFVKKICQIALDRPYIVNLLEGHVFKLCDDKKFISEFLVLLIKRSMICGATDALAYAFYLAIKLKILIDLDEYESILHLNDCISTLLAYKYCQVNNLDTGIFKEKANDILALSERDQDKFWLYLYEVLPVSKQKGFLKKLKADGVQFVSFEKKAEADEPVF